jgi:2-oxoglutarate dehydrogenase E1 component
MIRSFRKPLVLFTPKSLLRHKEAISSLDDLAKGSFQLIIGESDKRIDPQKVKRVIVCSGRLYFDLLAARREAERDDLAIIRVEQLYPFGQKAFEAEVKRYAAATDWVWAQDEPQNQGPWFYIQHHMQDAFKDGQRLMYAGRPASASPAVGYYDKHYAQLKELIATAFGDSKPAKRSSKAKS